MQVRLGTTNIDVCKKAFCAIHAVSRKRVEILASHIGKKSKSSAPVDMRGRHTNRPNAVPDEIIKQIDCHIQRFPRRSSHYSRTKNLKRYYLCPELNIKKIYELYLESYEPEVYKCLQDKKENGPKPVDTYDFFFRYFKVNYSNYSFGHPRSDTCQTCDKLENKLKIKGPPDEINAINLQKTLHLKKASVFYDDLREKSKLAKENPKVDVLCFDYQQNVPLPKVPSGDAFYLRQLWVFNFCIHSAKSGKAHFYMYDEITGKKTPNEPISFLHHYIENILDKNVTTLYIFSDNCAAQNKNISLVRFLYSLVHSGGNNIENVVHRYPEPGHSFLPCDRCFGMVEKSIRKIERVFLPNEYFNHFKKASRIFNVIPVTQDMILNYVEHFAAFFKKNIGINRNKERFTISKYRLIIYDSSKLVIQCSITSNVLICSEFTPTRSNNNIPILPNSRVYDSPLALKAVKLENIMKLANEYVPNNDLWYYRSLKAESFADEDGNETEYTDDGSCSDAE